MKKISILYFTVLLCSCSTILFGQSERNIIFMHGLGGSDTSWIKYDEYFNATRKANPIRISYSEDNGIPGAVAESQQKMAAAVLNNSYSQNIVIAHSQGGIVTRGIAKAYPESQRPFGGFITVGTPNLGAKVISSYKAGKFSAFTQDATQSLFAGPTPALMNALTPFIPNVSNSLIAGFVENQIVARSGIDLSTTNDFYPGAPYLTALNNFNINIPKVGIITQETTPNSHWKVLTSYTFKSMSEMPLGEEDDDDLEIYMKKAQNFYSAITLYYRFRATHAILPHWQIIYHKKVDAWEKGLKWFTNSEDKFLDLLGATGLVANTVTYSGGCNWPCSTYECNEGLSGCSFQSPSTFTYYTSTTYPTDGLVKLDAQNLPGAIENMLVERPNHAEQRNHPKMTEMFDAIFNGTAGLQQNSSALSYFIVPKI